MFVPHVGVLIREAAIDEMLKAFHTVNLFVCLASLKRVCQVHIKMMCVNLSSPTEHTQCYSVKTSQGQWTLTVTISIVNVLYPPPA